MKKPIANGFTLLELVVATGLLALIMLMATGIFSRTISVQRRDVAQQALQEDVRFALELLSREARTAYGSTYAMPASSAVMFRNQAGNCVIYRLDPPTKRLERAEIKTPGAECSGDDFTGQSFSAIHSPDTVFTRLAFKVVRAETDPQGRLANQGFITIVVEAVSRSHPDVSLQVETSVTSRQTAAFTPL